MAGTKISELPSATLPLTGSELVPVVQSGATVQTTLATMPYVPAGTGAVTTTVQAKLRQTVSVKDFGAVGDGTTDDTAAIQAAVASLPSGGGTVLIPSTASYYKITSPILDSGKRVKFVLEGGATIKPSVDTDVFRITGVLSSVEGGGTIDGGLVASGNGNGVVVGYGGANSSHVKVECVIKNMRGWGIVWEQGAFLTTDVLIATCVGGGILCTENYDDNNHGDILAHISNCTGAGFRTVYTATTSLRSRHHHFRQIKTFGCGGGGFLIETENNYGCVFAELNTGFQVKLDTNAWGNILFCTGANGEPDYTEVTANTNMLFGPQGGGYNYAVVRNMIAQGIKIRDRTNTGSFTAAMTGTNAATITNDNATNTDFILNLTNKDFGSGYNLIIKVDKIQWRAGSGTINAMITALVNLNFGTISAGASTTIATGYTAGVGDSVVVTWANSASSLPAGLILTPSINHSGGALSVVATNTTGGSLVIGTVTVRYMVMKHF
jgi:hypothetical protein